MGYALGSIIFSSLTTEFWTFKKSISSTLLTSFPSLFYPPKNIALSFWALTIEINSLGSEIDTDTTFHVFSLRSYISTTSVKFPS